ncbi:hypothetical protein Tco_0532975 [Tanacetum coccineum]
MSAAANSSVEQVSRGSGVVVTKQRLAFMVNQEIMEDALRVEDYKRMASQLENSVRRKCGYIAALKSRSDGEGSVEDLKFLERMRLEDLEKGTRLLLMMKETEMKIGEKITYVGSLGNDAGCLGLLRIVFDFDSNVPGNVDESILKGADIVTGFSIQVGYVISIEKEEVAGYVVVGKQCLAVLELEIEEYVPIYELSLAWADILDLIKVERFFISHSKDCVGIETYAVAL